MPYVSNDSYNGQPRRTGRGAPANSFANWILTRPEAACHGLVDDGDRGGLCRILARKPSTLEKRNVHRSEIVRADRAEFRIPLSGVRRRAALNHKAAPSGASKGEIAHDGRRTYSGHGLDSLEHLLGKRPHARKAADISTVVEQYPSPARSPPEIPVRP